MQQLNTKQIKPVQHNALQWCAFKTIQYKQTPQRTMHNKAGQRKHITQHDAEQQSTPQHDTTQHNTIQHEPIHTNPLHHNTKQHNIMRHNTIRCNTL